LSIELASARRMPVATRSSSKNQPFRVGRCRTGLGLFAVEPIKKGAFIAEYWGKLILTKTADDRNSKYLFEINTRWTVDGGDRRNIARYINHSCRPNAQSYIVKHTIKIRALRTIKPGEEITYNYGRNYFDTFIKPIGCKCAGCAKKRNGSKF
jgi:SET domain-containing protein